MSGSDNLLQLVARHEPLSLCAAVAYFETTIDPETYHEPSDAGLQVVSEVVGLNAIAAGEQEGTSPSNAQVDEIRDAARKTLFRIDRLIGTDRDPVGGSSVAGAAGLYHLSVRQPGYPHHLEPILRRLFGTGPIALWMEEALGFSIADALALIHALDDLTAEGLAGARVRARGEVKALRAALRRRGKAAASVADGAHPLLPRLRGMSVANREKHLRRIERDRFIELLGTSVSVTAEDLAAGAGVSADRARSFLEFRTCRQEHVQFPHSPIGVVEARPLLECKGRYLCFAPTWLLWGLQEAIESQLLAGPHHDAYIALRSKILEDEIAERLRTFMPGASVHQNLFFPDDTTASGRGEVDILVVCDTAILLVEAKSGDVTPPARRGAKSRVDQTLNKLLQEPRTQLAKVAAYLGGASTAVFLDKTGKEGLRLERDEHPSILQAIVTLEDMSGLTVSVPELVAAGALTADEVPWVASLADLTIVLDILHGPVELFDFLRWRKEINRQAFWRSNDELNWLMCYVEGFRPPAPEGVQMGMLSSFTVPLDDWYLFEQGHRVAPATKPKVPVPEPFSWLIEVLQRKGEPGWLTAALHLLDIPPRDWPDIRQSWGEAVRDAGRGGIVHRSRSFLGIDGRHAGVTFIVARGADIGELGKLVQGTAVTRRHKANAARWLGIGVTFATGEPEAIVTVHDDDPDMTFEELAALCEDIDNLWSA